MLAYKAETTTSNETKITFVLGSKSLLTVSAARQPILRKPADG